MLWTLRSAGTSDSSAEVIMQLCFACAHTRSSPQRELNERCLEVRLLLALRSSVFAEGCVRACVCFYIKKGDGTEVCVKRKHVSRTIPSSVFNEVFKH